MTMLKKNLLKNVFLAAVLATAGAVHAEDAGTGDGGQFENVSYEGNEALGSALTCREARETSWFEKELARTDGNVDPDVRYASCGNEMLADSTADAD
jgi:hypothetical protein